MLSLRLRLILAALWLGGLAAVGGIGAPTVFAILPERMVAAVVASRMFAEMADAAVVLGGLLLALERSHAQPIARSGPFFLVVAALALDVLGQWGVVPHLLESAAAHAPDAMRWHALASAVFLGQLACVLAYVWRLPGRMGPGC